MFADASGMRQLVPCPGCARHVRLSEAACPFCGDVSPRQAPPQRTLIKRSRAAIVGAALATSTAVTGCYDDHGRNQDAGVVTPDAAREPDAGGVISAYGTPFPDDAAFEDDAGAPAAEYGGPPMFEDAGFDAGMGDPGADYGGPPSD